LRSVQTPRTTSSPSPSPHRHHAGLRLQQPQPKSRLTRPRRPSPESHIDRYDHRRLSIRWRRCHCCRHSSDERSHSSRQGRSKDPSSTPNKSSRPPTKPSTDPFDPRLEL
jgi:hypothetical protein